MTSSRKIKPNDAPAKGRPGRVSAEFVASMTAEAALAALDSGLAGLSEEEVALRLSRYGPNVLLRVARRHWTSELALNFIYFFALLLWAGAALAWIAGMPQLAWAIVAVILINGLFSFWQEYQAERAAEALAALLTRRVTVRRGGRERLVSAEEIAPGDILILTEGVAIPADARIIREEMLRVDMSALTGESRPVPRSAESVDTTGRMAAMASNLVFAGTSVASGRGGAVAFATGATTEFGRIAALPQIKEERPGPLQRELRRVMRTVTVIAVSLGVSFFAIGTLVAKLPALEGFIFAIGIIVANVPEGLLPTLTLALA